MYFRNQYDFLSNFYSSPIKIGELVFPSVENAFQALKSKDEKDWVNFVNISPTQAKSLGRRIKIRDNWDVVRIPIMKMLLTQKFKDPGLLAKLKSIDEPIVEDNNWGDRFWGKTNGVGKNQLGILLMSIRDL